VCSAKALAERTSSSPQARPRFDDPSAIAQGRTLFRSRCSLCHGMDARGNRAPDITSGEWQTGRDDAALAKIIADGIPGTEMTGTSLHDDEVWMVVAYLHTIKGSTKPGDARGNAANGERIFWASDKGNC